MNPIESEPTVGDGRESSAKVGERARICPRCHQPTKRIEIRFEAIDWESRAQFAQPDRAAVCEHCGMIFSRRGLRGPGINRMIGVLLLGFCLLCVVAVILLLVFGAPS